MLIFPMPSTPSTTAVQRDPSPYSLRSQREESPQSTELRKQVASTMLATLPPRPPPMAPLHQSRPKLSLQTSLFASLKNAARDPFTPSSPTTHNTRRNAQPFIETPPTPLSTTQPQADFPLVDPLPSTAIDPNRRPSILRCGSERASPRTYSPHCTYDIHAARPIKRVTFTLQAPEIMPTPVIPASPAVETFPSNYPQSSDVETSTSGSCTTVPSSTETIETTAPPFAGLASTLSNSEDLETARRLDRRALIQAEDGHATPIAGAIRKKRPRDWIWRPVDGEAAEDEGSEGQTDEREDSGTSGNTRRLSPPRRRFG